MTTEEPRRDGAAPTDPTAAETADVAAAAAPAPAEGAGAEPEAPPAVPERRALKLVVSCRQEGGDGRVLLALGADGCDPVFRAAAAGDLVAALDEVPALLAEAEERWRARPRYPAAAKPRPSAARQRPEAAPAPPAGGTATPEAPRARPAPSPKPAPAGQMALFG